MTRLSQDARYAVRTLIKTPGFTLAIIISIALGIAANTTVFSIAEGLLFGVLPVRNSERLVSFPRAQRLFRIRITSTTATRQRRFLREECVRTSFSFPPASAERVSLSGSGDSL